MKNSGGTAPDLVDQLQEAARAGRSATQLLALWRSAVEARDMGRSSRMEMLIHFKEAFAWSLGEMSVLGAWRGFGDSAWTDEMIDTGMAPRLKEWRAGPRVSSDGD